MLRGNADYLDEMQEAWRADPDSVSETWSAFFQGFEMAMCPKKCEAADFAKAQSNIASLIFAYRARGYSLATTDPLEDLSKRKTRSNPEFELANFELKDEDLDKVFDVGHLAGPRRASLRDIITTLEDTYCRSVGVEYVHIQDREVRRWLQQQMEPFRNRPPVYKQRKMEILRLLIDAELFETFTARHYPGQKRFSLEGAEALIPAMHEIIELGPELGVEEVVIGMAHRGRLNVLANILDKSYAMIFSEFEDALMPDQVGGDGDVKYHRGYNSNHVNRAGSSCHLSLTSNPSHLEAVNPVVEGRVRAKQAQRKDTQTRRKVLPLLIHGDAAFAGQGVVAETLNLSQLQGYRTGGTIHIVVNNQIGFTTSPTDARSSRFATDVAKMIEAPIFHVNGDDPEAVVHVSEMALRYRQQFGRDVVIDMICYRRHGHNEGDEPRFTQPVLYSKIKKRPSARNVYTDALIKEGVLTDAQARQIGKDFEDSLLRAFEHVKAGETPADIPAYRGRWDSLDQPWSFEPAATGVPRERLLEIAADTARVPKGFEINPKVLRRLPELGQAIKGAPESAGVDWAGAEKLAFASLLQDGYKVRLSGQDCGRGTFSHRHAVWHDMKSGNVHVPLQHLSSAKAPFKVYDSLLSEAAVLGFEYGYSLAEPNALILWEAQFGDFSNGAQVIVDQFLMPAESKWQRSSSLVMLLPHGYEGQGPEHSNAYLERYLMACAEDNVQVCNVTTPAQYFHLLRRQLARPFRKPLVIMSPKSLLRHKQVVSPAEDFIEGSFQEFIDDPARPEKTRRLVLVSGKLYYDLLAGREAAAPERVKDVALLRVEQFYPLNEERLRALLKSYDAEGSLEEIVWAQEEPLNRGGWIYMSARVGPEIWPKPLRYVGRPAAASPAVGSMRKHREGQAAIVAEALGLDPTPASN